jgi:hypothetical protein
MSRSACTLKHLDTDDIMMSALMTEIPSLIELSLRDAEDTDERWQALLTAIACGYLSPKLQKTPGCPSRKSPYYRAGQNVGPCSSSPPIIHKYLDNICRLYQTRKT